ncbi:MAG: FAD-binding oxidoreductase [Rhodoferax sp.]|uniref:NAD(P)/FAD-dependent oxidoreductase n=1 Tax=Rhodoferax sp. TaxID=50421 RepID=UPI00273629C9|nr:FAD-binding oxidoreductase [Rhodoferax sp.]MDP2680250.1 FAD-binding oxidoreductase [Rhodoferax sp.]
MLVRQNSPHVIVIGAGIVGAATAFYLSRAGAKVTVLDADTPSAGATGASDGAVSVASKRPGVMMQLARQARDLYAQLVHEEILTDLFHTRPTYLFARSDLEVTVIAAQQRDLNSQNEPTLWLDRAGMMRRVPGLGSSVLAGLKVPKDGHAIGYQVTHRLLSCANVVPLRHTPVLDLVLSGQRVIGVETPAGRILADVVVLAAGIDSMAFLGLDKVMIPRKGQLIVTDRAAFGYAVLPGPLMSASYLAAKHTPTAKQSSVSLVIDPLRTGQFLLGSSRETGVLDRQTDIRTVATILREAIDVYPPLARQRVIRTFAGIRATTEDGLPIVGRHPELDGLILATAMQGDGICLGPLVGAAVARWALEQDSAQDLSALTPSRFLKPCGSDHPHSDVAHL